jgi:hypothetical protein
MEVKVVISTETAIEEGHAQSGIFTLSITDEFVADLNEAEREELICLVRNSTDASLWNGAGLSISCKSIDRPSLPALKSLIQRRIVARDAAILARDESAARENAKQVVEAVATIRKWCESDIEDRLRLIYGGYTGVSKPSLWPVKLDQLPEDVRVKYESHLAQLEEIAVSRSVDAKREKDEQAACKEREAAECKANIKKWLAEHGSVSMQEREAEGLLPEKELLDVVRERLFEPLIDHPRYVRLAKGDARHGDSHYDDEITFDVSDADELTGLEFERLKELRIDASKLAEPAEVQAREHRVVCQGEGCPDATMRRSALVTVEWNGFKLTREYALTCKGEDSYID